MPELELLEQQQGPGLQLVPVLDSSHSSSAVYSLDDFPVVGVQGQQGESENQSGKGGTAAVTSAVQQQRSTLGLLAGQREGLVCLLRLPSSVPQESWTSVVSAAVAVVVELCKH